MFLFVLFFFLPAFKNISSKLAMHGVTVGGDYRWVQISGICVFGERRSCVSQGHYNSLCSHHSYGCFLPAGLGFWRSDVGLVCMKQNQGWMNVSISIYCGCSWKHVVKTAPLLSYWWNPHPTPPRPRTSSPFTHQGRKCYSRRNIQTAVVSITCLLSSSACPSETSHHSDAVLWVDRRPLMS